jgi:hypothetical protein
LPTTIWIIFSSLSAIVVWVLLYFTYVFIFAPLVTVSDFVAQNFGGTYPQLLPLIANVVSEANAAFVAVAVGVFVFLMIVGYFFEPTSTSIGGGF